MKNLGPKRIIKNACVITIDPGVGVLEHGDILIEGAKILEVAPELHVESAELFDGAGTIAISGLIDSHRHLTHTVIRTTGSDDTNFTYFMNFVQRRKRPLGRFLIISKEFGEL
jgi:cytosine/adenosine deaminase-related metal-dependent hydrolase